MDGGGHVRTKGPYRSRRVPSVADPPVGVESASFNVRRATRRRGAARALLPLACRADAVPTAAMRLTPPTFCSYCQAKKIQYETPCFCCSKGEVKVRIPEIPVEIMELYEGQDGDCKNFRLYCRLYNNLFAFCSLGGDAKGYTYKGIYVFKLHGQMYHQLPSLLPEQNEEAKYLQLYFYDGEYECDKRTGLFDSLCSANVSRLMRIMEVNPYAQFFKSLRGIPIYEHTSIKISKNPSLDQNVFNAPTSSEVAAIILDSTASSDTVGPSIIVTGKDEIPRYVKYYYGCYDPLQYPLLFPYGHSGWRPGLSRYNPTTGRRRSEGPDPVMTADTSASVLDNEEMLAAAGIASKAKQISCREYYACLLQIHPNNCLLRTGRLFQQFCVDMYVKLENSRLDFFRFNQAAIRADLYQGIIDTAETGENNSGNVGHRIVLPPSFIGGPRDMQRRYLNAMALVQRYGKPDLFVTMTCNPNWPEIKEELRPGELAQNRPDLVARIFRAKLVHFRDLMINKHIFGEVAAFIYVIEFQKRGLPHAHFLIILKPDFKVKCPEDYDRYVSAELPPTSQPHLRKCVIQHMLHGPCGALNPNCGCMRDINGQQQCRFDYPKSYSSYTTTNKDGYPSYRRTNTGETVLVRGVELDNRWVIPYNPYLLALFDCHINVEVCATIEAVKYLYKYVYKGHDRVAFNISNTQNQEPCNEIDQFQKGRWISPPEAVWRLFGFDLCEVYPPVLPLQVHLPNMQSVSFSPDESVSSILSDEMRSRTMLTEYFATNRANPDGPQYLYSEFPEHYTWDRKAKCWNKRKRGMEAAMAHGLVENDDAAERCMDEAICLQMAPALRRLFVTLLVFCNPPNPRTLWEKYQKYLSEDVQHRHPDFSQQKILFIVTQQIKQLLDGMGKKLQEFGLDDVDQQELDDVRVIRDIQDILEAPISEEHIAARKLLNAAQKRAYKAIVHNVKNDIPGCFFIDGPGGTGKTFLYNALYAKIRSKDKIVLPTASSGIAAANLPCGRTAHSRFKLPIDHDAHLTCNVPKQGALASLLKKTSLIIWDEAPMSNKASVHSLDLLLRDVCDSDLPFGGKVIVLGGDFRQVLPVVPKKTQHEAVEASIVSSFLWPSFTRFCLTENMRARTDPDFARFLLMLGDGRLQHDEVADVRIPEDMIVSFAADSDPVDMIIKHIFPEFEQEVFSSDIFIDRSILTPRNDEVDLINSSIIEKFPGEAVTYYSIDKLVDDNCNLYPVEFLHTLAPGGMTPHELKLKKNCPVMLLRNLDPAGGLCNGTRIKQQENEAGIYSTGKSYQPG